VADPPGGTDIVTLRLPEADVSNTSAVSGGTVRVPLAPEHVAAHGDTFEGISQRYEKPEGPRVLSHRWGYLLVSQAFYAPQQLARCPRYPPCQPHWRRFMASRRRANPGRC